MKLFIILNMFILSGCCILGPISTPHINTYELTIAPSTKTCTNNIKNATLQIMQMRTLPPFNSNKMFYSTSNNLITAFEYNQWASPPSEMLTNNILQYLNSKCIYTNVISANIVANTQYRLNTELTRLSLDTQNDKSYVNMIITAQLIENSTNNIVKNKIFIIKQLSDNKPNAMVEVSNQLEILFLNQLATWLAN